MTCMGKESFKRVGICLGIKKKKKKKINPYNNHINSLKREIFIINLNSYRKIFCQNSKTLSKVMIEGNSLN